MLNDVRYRNKKILFSTDVILIHKEEVVCFVVVIMFAVITTNMRAEFM